MLLLLLSLKWARWCENNIAQSTVGSVSFNVLDPLYDLLKSLNVEVQVEGWFSIFCRNQTNVESYIGKFKIVNGMACNGQVSVCPSVRLSLQSIAAAFRTISAAGARAQQQRAGSVSAVIRGGSTQTCFKMLTF